jgi:hypothetical protein
MTKPNEPTRPHGEKPTGRDRKSTRRPYRKPVLRSTDAYTKLALQSCAANDTPEDECLPAE